MNLGCNVATATGAKKGRSRIFVLHASAVCLLPFWADRIFWKHDGGNGFFGMRNWMRRCWLTLVIDIEDEGKLYVVIDTC